MNFDNIQGSFKLLIGTYIGLFILYILILLIGLFLVLLGVGPETENFYITTSDAIINILKIIVGVLPIFIICRMLGINDFILQKAKTTFS